MYIDCCCIFLKDLYAYDSVVSCLLECPFHGWHPLMGVALHFLFVAAAAAAVVVVVP